MSEGKRERPSVVSHECVEDGTIRVNNDAIRRLSVVRTNIRQQQEDARLATNAEKTMTVRQAVRLYKWAIIYSMAMSLAVVMEGYDLAAMGSFLGYDQFRQRFGTELDLDGNPRISPAWQAGIQNGVQAGSILGLWANGYVAESFGYKKTMYGALLASVIFNFLHFFAQGIGMIVAGSVLLGLPWGIFQTLTVTYASDITPSTIRPYLTTYINLCWVMGQFVAAGALRGCQTLGNDWGWRIPVAIQWVWVPFIFLGAYMAPESPWWLVRKGRYEEARASLVKATTPQPDVNFDPDQALALIRHTNDLEQAMNNGVNYIDCFKGVEKRRTLIACVVWLTQALCGAAMMGYSVQIYRESGLDEEGALNLNIGQYCLGVIGTVGSWFLMRRIGRRTLYNWGLIILFSFLMVIGGLGVISRDDTGAAWALGSILLVYTLFYNFTVGPVCYAIVAETSSTRLKIKTVVLARNVYNLGSIFNNIVVPRMLSPNEWNWAGMTGFFYAALTALLIIFMWFMLPETKDRTFAELDVLFENKVPARKFDKTDVDQLSGHTTAIRVDSSDESSSDGEKPRALRREEVQSFGGVHV
ncbi:sugar transporter [Didymella exigua CBS 183.55]|uniref:Sugar transporter n=1 Tax=Didymella exigua CBS 183.55 TaxID=1150837 RepID=A0A6A5RU48_9PLEO|nr:sugar transporter [Didymella exigua CBS 183.55]KAF1931995.1 sugar transporter [Didymella exigua CBS 183.55]